MTGFQDGWGLILVGGVPTLDTSLAISAFNPFGPSGGPATTLAVTARYLVDSARIRHGAFADVNLGDGAALLFLNQRQREHLSKPGAAIEGLVGTTCQYAVGATAPTGLFVSTYLGVPYVLNTGEAGWCVHVDINGVPFMEAAEPQIAPDPIGRGGVPTGFPLPGEMVRLVNVVLIYSNATANGQFIPCTVINERGRITTQPGRDPTVFVSNNRLVPVLAQPAGPANSADRWYNVIGIQISWVPIVDIRALDDELLLPQLLTGALIADLVSLLANQAKGLTPQERQMFKQEAMDAGGVAATAALEVLESTELEQVQYRG